MKIPEIYLGKRAAQTLLFVTAVRTFRVDLDRKGVIISDVSIIETVCANSNALPACLETVINLSETPLGKKVWLQYSQLHTFTLSLPSVQVQGVDDVILEQALLFELETLTGQSTSNAKLAYRFISDIDEMTYYWVNAVAEETLNRILEICKKSHCKLAGLLHPGGLPMELGEDSHPSWSRIECWPNCKVALAKTPDAGFTITVIDTSGNTLWQTELDQWLRDTGGVDSSETLMSGQIEYLAKTDVIYRLQSEDQLVVWLGHWGYFLSNSQKISPPMLQARASANLDLIYMVSGGLGALLLCSLHAGWSIYQENYYQHEIEYLKKVESDINGINKRIADSKTKQNELQSQLQVLSQNINVIPAAIEAMRVRPALMLMTLAKNSPGEIVIEHIMGYDQGLVIAGVSLQPHLPSKLASRTMADLNAVGWRVLPPKINDLNYFEEGGPWGFAIPLQDLGLKGFVTDD